MSRVANDNSDNWGYDNQTHYLIQLKQPPSSLQALRTELVNHPDIVEYAQQGTTFEECIGRIAVKLDIALDGLYDVEKLCQLLWEVLKDRKNYLETGGNIKTWNVTTSNIPGLVSAELVEKEGEVSLEKSPNTSKKD